MNRQEKHSQLITLGPGCYFVLTVWIEILGSQAADARMLAEATAISTPTIRKYLAKLRALGFILPAGERWQLAGNQVQLDFLGADDESGEVVPVIDIQAEDVETVDKIDETVDKTGENDDFEKKNFFSPIIINKESLIKDSINNNNNGEEKNFFPDGEDQDTIQAMKDCGIQLNIRTKGLLGKVTARDVRREWGKLRDYGRQHETGLLITILEGVAEKIERMGAGRSYADWEA